MLDSFKQSSFKISEPTISNTSQKDLYSILIIGLSLLILRLDFSQIINSIELTTISYAQSMIENHDYRVLQILGEYYFNQGPLVSWIYVFSLKIAGNIPVLHRLLTSIIAFSSLGLIYYLISMKYNPRISWITTILLISSPLFFVLSGLINTDIFLAISLIIFLLSFWEVVCTDGLVSNSLYWIMYLSFTVTFLISGLMPIYFLLVVLFINKILNQNLGINFNNMLSLIGLPFITFCFGWLILSGINHPDFVYEYLILQYWQELIFFDYRVLISFALLIGLFIAAGFPWSLLFLGFVNGRFNKEIFISDQQKYLLSIMIAGSIIFCHLKRFEMVIAIVILFPSFIFVAQLIDDFRLTKTTTEIINIANKICLGSLTLSAMLITYVSLQINISITEKVVFILIVSFLLFIPYSCRKTVLKYGLYHVFIRLTIYNILVLLTAIHCKYVLLN